jgi:hypothetical protein
LTEFLVRDQRHGRRRSTLLREHYPDAWATLGLSPCTCRSRQDRGWPAVAGGRGRAEAARFRPDRFDILGVIICLIGVVVITCMVGAGPEL